MRNYEDIDFYLNGWESPLSSMLKRLMLSTKNQEEKSVGVYIYKTLRYPPKSIPPNHN